MRWLHCNDTCTQICACGSFHDHFEETCHHQLCSVLQQLHLLNQFPASFGDLSIKKDWYTGKLADLIPTQPTPTLSSPSSFCLVNIPPFRKHCAREIIFEDFFLRYCSKCCNRLLEITLVELLLGRLRDLVVALCFLTVFAACFQEAIFAMALLPLCQNSSE